MINKNEKEFMTQLGKFEQQIHPLQQQLEAVEHGIEEMNSLNLGLNELINGTGKEILAQIGRGIFVKAKLISEELTVDIGGKNFVKKSIPETRKIIMEQIKKLGEIKEELEKALSKIEKELTETMNEMLKKENCECSEECNKICGDDYKCTYKKQKIKESEKIN